MHSALCKWANKGAHYSITFSSFTGQVIHPRTRLQLFIVAPSLHSKCLISSVSVQYIAIGVPFGRQVLANGRFSAPIESAITVE